MVEAIGPVNESPGAEVEFGGVKIAGRRIDAQRVGAFGCGNSLGRADRGGVEEQLRKKCRPVFRERVTRFALEDFERWNLGGWWVGRQVEDWDAFIVAEGVGHVGPVEEVLSAAKLFDGVFCEFMVVAPRHLVRLD